MLIFIHKLTEMIKISGIPEKCIFRNFPRNFGNFAQVSTIIMQNFRMVRPMVHEKHGDGKIINPPSQHITNKKPPVV